MAAAEERWRRNGDRTGRPSHHRGLSTGAAAIDAHLQGAAGFGVHAVAPASPWDEALAAGFALRLAMRWAHMGSRRTVLWASAPRARQEGGRLYGPGVQSCGARPGAIVCAALAHDRDVLIALEEAAGAGALAAAYGEAAGGDLTAMRRLALAAAAGATPIFLAMPWRAHEQGVGAATRWRVSAAPSAPRSELPAMPGEPRLRTTLLYARSGRPGSWTTEWDDETHAVRVVPEMAAATASTSHGAAQPRRLRANG